LLLWKHLKIPGSEVTIYTDSKYVADAVTKGWVFDWVKKRFKGKKNPDSVVAFSRSLQKARCKICMGKRAQQQPVKRTLR
jgi:ribonuclease HI